MTPASEQEIRDIISQIPDFVDRIILLRFMKYMPLELSRLATDLLKPLEEQKK